ncbi:MAG: tetratricopeptide repeat protein [Candidatus Omnitrophota bacterium]
MKEFQTKNLKKNLILCSIIILFMLFPQSYCGAQTIDQNVKEEESIFIAQKAIEDGFYDVALSLLERFLAQYPSSPRKAEVNLLMGECYFHQSKFLDALGKFNELLNQPLAGDIQDAVLYWIAEVHFRGNNYRKAAVYYQSVIDKFPKSPYLVASYYSLGWCLFQDQKYKEALEYFGIIETKYPHDQHVPDAAFKIVECLYNLKDYTRVKEKAKAYLKVYSKDNVRTAYFYFYLAEADYYLNNFSDAMDEYSKVLAKTTDEKTKAVSLLGMAWSVLRLKQYEQAQTIFSSIKSENLEKRSIDVLLLGKAILNFELKNFPEAKIIYESLINTTEDPAVLLQAYLGKADSLYNLGEFKAAEAFYKAGLNKASEQPAAGEITDKLHYGLAWTFFKEGEFKEAIKEFQKIATQSADQIVKISALCQIGDAYQDSGDYAKAQDAYDSILKGYPDSLYNDYVQYQLGLTQLKTAAYEGAIMSFLSLKKNFPKSKLIDDASYALGLAYFQKQDYRSSKEIFETFIADFKDSPMHAQAMYLLGSSLFNLEEFSAAIEAFKNILRAYSQDAELCQKAEYEIADCYYQMGNEPEAMSRFKALRTKYPDSTLTAEIMWWLGEYYYRHNDLNLAGRYFSSLISDFPKSNLINDAYYVLGSIYVEQQKYRDAMENFQKVIDSGAPDLSGQAYIAIADIYANQEKTEKAFNAYREISDKFPHLRNLVFPKIADLLGKEKKFKEAVDYYEKSLELVPARETAQIMFKIAEAWQAQGDFSRAVESYLKVTYLHADNTALVVKSLLRAAQIHEDKPDIDQARKFYQRIAEMNVPEAKFAREKLEALKPARKQ